MLPPFALVLVLQAGCASRAPAPVAATAELSSLEPLVYQVGFT